MNCEFSNIPWLLGAGGNPILGTGSTRTKVGRQEAGSHAVALRMGARQPINMWTNRRCFPMAERAVNEGHGRWVRPETLAKRVLAGENRTSFS